MKIFRGFLLYTIICLQGFCELNVGDNASKIIEELGEPSGKIDLGSRVVYSYPEGSIHVKDGVIVQLSENFNKTSNEFTRNTSDGQQIQLSREDPNLVPKDEPENNSLESSEHSIWLEDAEQAFSESKASGKPVLMLFTGSDWCSWCQRLEREILNTNTFKNGTSEVFVLLKLDYPKKVIQGEDRKAQNSALKEKWEVQGYPTLIVVNSEDKELGRTGYNGMVPADYVEHLISFTQISYDDSEGELVQKMRGFLGDDFADSLESIEVLDSVSMDALSLSFKLMLGSVLVFYVVRRFMKR